MEVAKEVVKIVEGEQKEIDNGQEDSLREVCNTARGEEERLRVTRE